MAQPRAGKRDIEIPTIDISGDADRHVMVARGTPDTYQGHPTTLLLPDGRTMFCVWTLDHGGPCGPLKRSDDGGITWRDLLPVPETWQRVRNCPTLYRLTGPDGVSRLVVFAGQGPDGSMHRSLSVDNGRSWSAMVSTGLDCVMPFCAIVPVDAGRRLLGMSNIRRPGETVEQRSNVVAQSMSEDGGLTWNPWRVVVDIPGCKPCEPELIRSPDGGQLLCLMRENNRAFNAWMMVSDDDGRTWSSPRQLPASLSGDRHAAAYAPDGRLLICFRDTAAESLTKDHFVGWVGTYEDIVQGREGHYRVKLLHSYAGSDCGYPGVECLPDGTIAATTYIKYQPGPDKHSVVSVRFTLAELDRIVRGGLFMAPEGSGVASCAEPNLAPVATVAASSEFHTGTYPAANATDGDLSVNGRWVSDRGDRHWLMLTWPEPRTIARVRVWTGSPGRPELRIADYTLETWDGATWQTAAAVTDNDKAGPDACNDLRFRPVTSERLRLVITRTPMNHARVLEVAVYGPPGTPRTLGPEPQLFVDDQEIARQQRVTRTVHACDKLPEPVLVQETAWEGDARDRRVYIYGTVLRDADSGTLRMWYNRMTRVLYATSADGARWERPELGLVQFEGARANNIVFEGFHSPSVILDRHAANPAERYRMLGCIPGKGYAVAHSEDGLHWERYPINPVLPGGDTCTLAQDPRSGEFLAFHKRHARHRGHPRRLVYLATSPDMQTWSEPRLVMAPDAADDAQTLAEGGTCSEFYNMSVFPYGGQFLGLVTHFRFRGRPPREGPGQSPDDGPIDVQLVHSRDGRRWHRLAQRRAVIPNGPHGYDAGCILGVANTPVIAGDAMWLYYTAITTTHGGFLPEKEITIARAAWRLDGFVSLDAGSTEGVVETTLFRPAGKRLVVNADAAGGELRVEILDADGATVPGFSSVHCHPVRSDSVRHHLRWTAHDELPGNHPIAVRIHMRNTSLYSYRVE